MIEIREEKRVKGCDCYGNETYEHVYVVTDEDGNVLLESKDDPTPLINYLMK